MGDTSQQQQQQKYALDMAHALAAQQHQQNQTTLANRASMPTAHPAQQAHATMANAFVPQFPFVNYNLHGQPVANGGQPVPANAVFTAPGGGGGGHLGNDATLAGGTMPGKSATGHPFPQTNVMHFNYPQQQQQQQQQQNQPTHHTVNGQTVKVRKPYTITKQRERWTEQEHDRFVEALKLHGRAWRKIEEHIGTKTAVQIRSHAQKFFAKLQKEHQKSLEADQMSDVTKGGGNTNTEDGATTRDTQTSGEGPSMNVTTVANVKDPEAAKKLSGNNNSTLLMQALMGNKSKSEVTGNSKEEDDAELLSNLASGDKRGQGTVKRTSSMSTGRKTTASDIPPARPKRKPAHPYPRKQTSLTNKQTHRGALPTGGFTNVMGGRTINESLIDVAMVEQHASASAAQALMNATSEMVRNRIIQEMQMQQLIQQQQQQQNKNGSNNNNMTANPLLANLAMQQEVPNPLSQLQALMAANPMLAAMNFGGGIPGMPNMAAVAANSNGGLFIPNFAATMNNTNNIDNTKAPTTDANNNNNNNNNKSKTEEGKPTTDKAKSSDVSEDAKIKPNSQSAFSDYVKPTTNNNQYRQTGSAATTTTTARANNNSSHDNNNNNNDAAVMAAVQQHQQMQYWNAQMAALAAMQDPNSFAQFLQQQQMGNMSMSQQQARQAQRHNAYVAGTDLKSEPTKASLEAVADAAAQEKNADRETKTVEKTQAAMETPTAATDAGKTAKLVAETRTANAPQVPKEIELAMANKEESPDSDKNAEEEENKNGNNSNKDTITNTTTTTTGRRSRRAAAAVAAEKVTKQVNGGRTTRRNNNGGSGGSGSGSGSSSRNQNQQGGKKNQSSGSDGSDDVALKGFESTSFRVYHEGQEPVQ